MNFENGKALDIVLQSLFAAYKSRVPDVSKVSQSMIDQGIIKNEGEIVNDHIAFRTMGVPNLGIQSFEKIFLHFGYQKKDYYYFEKKKLDAYWYAPPSPEYPRIFLSELRVEELSEKSQAVIAKYTSNVVSDPIEEIDLNDLESIADYFYKPLWKLPTLQDYQDLLAESEYAAWVIFNRYYLNHYTVSIQHLKDGYNSLELFNKFLEDTGIVLNSSGGVIKTSKDGLLKQSSTVAKMIEAKFAGGQALLISGSYVEFSERLPLPAFQHLNPKDVTNEQRRDGFEAANADKIFESTYSDQTGRLKD